MLAADHHQSIAPRHYDMPHVNIEKLERAQLATQPFEHTVIPAFLDRCTIERINETFPPMVSGGSFAIESLAPGMVIKDVIEQLDCRPFEKAIEEKFGIELAGRPKMFSLRGFTREKDGRIHRDSKDKIITALLYLNRDWPHKAGRLRLLRDQWNLNNYVVEVPPDNGTLLVFKRSSSSWHGHFPFVGQRRALQMNWVTGAGSKVWHRLRHSLSAKIKRLTERR
jgi:SM-20-related protein